MNATKAASQAFLAKPPSHGALSSSAAAAALRSHTTSPEPVGNIQTKRMVRRASQSSVGSPTRGGVGRGGLMRRNSSSSMTERTFRSPSPSGNRNGAMSPTGNRNGAMSPIMSTAAPVPRAPAGAAKKTQRSSSVDPPARVLSPTPPKGGRGMSVDRGSSATAASSASKARKRLSDVPELLLEDNSNAISYSRRGNESPVNAPATSKSSWFLGPSGTAVSGARPATSDGLQSAGNKGKSTGRQQQQRNQSGSAAAPEGASLPASYEGADSVMVYDANTRSFVQRPKSRQAEAPPSPDSPSALSAVETVFDPASRTMVTKPRVTRAVRAAPDAPAAASDIEVPPMVVQKQRKKPAVVEPVDTDLEPPPRNPARVSSASPTSPRAQGLLQKQPSIVREEPEEEEEAESSSPAHVPQQTNRSVSNTAAPLKTYATPTANRQRSVSLDVPPSQDASARGRNSSHSPSRSLHFSSNPVVGGTRHVPPSRSISPQKSALKYSPGSSVRTVSPTAPVPPVAMRAPPSDTSDANSLDSQEVLGMKKKKSARVSFNEKPAEIVSRPGNAKRVGREIASAVDDDMDEVMQPRPALPSFGSVARNAGRPGMAEKATEQPPDRNAQGQHISSDHVVGSVLANHHAKEPETTSKEGIGYISEESEASFEPNAASTSVARIPGAPSSTAAEHDAEAVDGEVPGINLQPPTPGVDEDEEDKDLAAKDNVVAGTAEPSARAPESQEVVGVRAPASARTGEPRIGPQPHTYTGDRLRYSIPGGWGEMEGGPSKAESEARASQVSPAETGQPLTSQEYVSSLPVLQPGIDRIEDESDQGEDSVAFSDAEEDLSNRDDGGFASLDAIVKGPAVNARDPEETDNSPSRRLTDKFVQKAEEDHEKPNGSGDWSQATAYWSKLSRQQKMQIEREALSSDDELRPPPVVRKTSRKKKRRSVEVPREDAAAPEDETDEPAPAALRKTAARDTGEQSKPSAMRSSMRQPAPQKPQVPQDDGEVHIRKSMRSSSVGSSAPRQRAQRSLSDQREPRGAAPTKNLRPKSSGQLTSSGLPAPPMGNARPQSAGHLTNSGLPASAMGNALLQNQRKPQPTRTNSRNAGAPSGPPASRSAANDSDSESSFRKSKRRSSNASTMDTNRYSMKRSMRGESSERLVPEQRPISPQPANQGRGAWSIRSLSPGPSNAPRNRENLRSSLRAPSVDASDSRSLRGPPAPRSASKSRFSGFGRSNKNKEPELPPRSQSKVRFSSRYDNDSDNEKKSRGGRVFKSRFASDDEGESGPSSLPPVRGIPRRQGQDDGDSTDLSGETDDDDPRKSSRRREKQAKPGVPDPADVEKAMALARRNLGMDEEDPSNGNGHAARKGTEGSALGRGSLRNAAAEDDTEDEEVDEPAPMPAKKRGIMGSILRRNRNSTSSIPQDAQQQQHTDSPGKMNRRASTQAHARSSSMAPRSRKRDSKNDRHEPEIRSSFERQRPGTNDGNVKMARTMRPEGGYDYAEQDARDDQAVYSEKTGRKKKFGRLRRVFGLHD